MNRRVGEVRSGCFRVCVGETRERERKERKWSGGSGLFEVKLPFFPPLKWKKAGNGSCIGNTTCL